MNPSISKKHLKLDFSVKSSKNQPVMINLRKTNQTPFTKKDKPSYTIKYVGEIEGQLGIGTKKIYEENKHFKGLDRIIFNNPTLNSYNNKFWTLPNNENTHRVYSGFRGKSAIGRRNIHNVQQKENFLSISCANKKKTVKFPSQNINSRNTEFFDIKNFSTSGNILTSNSIINSKISIRSPHTNKLKVSCKYLSDSEKVFPQRYIKPLINLREYVIQHNAYLRNFPQGKKFSETKSYNEETTRINTDKNRKEENNLFKANHFLINKLY